MCKRKKGDFMFKKFLAILLVALAFSCAKEEGQSAYFDEASALFNEGKLEEAERLLEKFSKRGFDYDELFLAAKIKFYSGKPDEARILLEKILDENDKYRDASLLLMRIFLDEGDLEDCASMIDEQLEFDPYDPRLLALKGELLQLQGRPEEALSFFNFAASFSDSVAMNYIAAARIYYFFNIKEKALENYNLALKFLSKDSAIRKSLEKVIKDISVEK